MGKPNQYENLSKEDTSVPKGPIFKRGYGFFDVKDFTEEHPIIAGHEEQASYGTVNPPKSTDTHDGGSTSGVSGHQVPGLGHGSGE